MQKLKVLLHMKISQKFLFLAKMKDFNTKKKLNGFENFKFFG